MDQKLPPSPALTIDQEADMTQQGNSDPRGLEGGANETIASAQNPDLHNIITG